jgi:hypothetical protein
MATILIASLPHGLAGFRTSFDIEFGLRYHSTTKIK